MLKEKTLYSCKEKMGDPTAEHFSEIMNTTIENAVRAESERDTALEQRDIVSEELFNLSKSLVESERRLEMLRVFAPLASMAIQLYNDEYYMMNYENMAEEYAETNFAVNSSEYMISVPESIEPVDIEDPICRYELVRVLNDMGYIAEAYENRPMSNCDMQISDRVGNECTCWECGVEWVVQRGVEEKHEPGCISTWDDSDEEEENDPLECDPSLFT